MAQHDYVIANGSGSAVRSDLNNALAAIVSHNSGTSEPTTTYAYMPWADTSAGVMKLRNGANNAWITLYQLDGEYTTIPLENGTAAAPSLYFKTSGTDTGLYSPGTDQVAISTAGTGRLFVGASGNVGIGTTSPGARLDILGTTPSLHISDNTSGTPDYRGYTLDLSARQQTGGINFLTSSPSAFLDLYAGGSAANLGDWDGQIRFFTGGTNSYGTERARIDSSGRLLVGTTSPLITYNLSASGGAYGPLQVVAKSTGEANSLLATFQSLGLGHQLSFATSRGSSVGTPVQSGDTLGRIAFFGDDGSTINSAGASIHCAVDATPGVGDMPGRLVFSTTADGGSTPTERLRISNNGQLSAVIPGNSTLYPGFMARAWVNFNGTGTVAIRASGNVSSITDNGEGDYTVNFTTAMADANYAISATASAFVDSVAGRQFVCPMDINTPRTASACRIATCYPGTDNAGSGDAAQVNVTIFR